MRSATRRNPWSLAFVAIALVLIGCAVGLMKPPATTPGVTISPGAARVLAPVAAPQAVRVIGGPRVPHDKHATNLECIDCHELDDKGEPGYPDVDFCLDCHEDMQEDDEVPEEQWVENVYFEDEKPRWTKAIQEYGGDVKFNHAAHAGKVECTDCHKDMDRRERLAKKLYTMAECMQCHQAMGAPNDCQACHQHFRRTVAPPDHRVNWEKRHGQVVSQARASGEAGNCQYCHEQPQFCNDCHQNQKPASHGPQWEGQHGLVFRQTEARGQRNTCIMCHTQPQFCNDCHFGRPPTSHYRDWEHQHGRLVLSAGGPGQARCTFCHADQRFCDDCHMNVKPSSHKHLWMRRHGALLRAQGVSAQARCQFCHDSPSFCEDCHQVYEPQDHTNLFRTRTHGLMAAIDRTRCMVCHTTDYCVRCHSETSPRSHRGMWARGRSTHCMTCHFPISSNPSCRVCHRSNPTHDTAPPIPAAHPPGLNCRICHNASGGGGARPLRHLDNGSPCQACHR